MTAVFLSGSRKISRLNDIVLSRVQGMLDQSIHVVIGDANGADKALQKYLADQHYRNVLVFYVGRVCRNNVGDWDMREVFADRKLEGRAFYAKKDKEMASLADYGFVIWDGKSIGSINNVYELLKNGKMAIVYLAQEKRFIDVRVSSDLEDLLQCCNQSDYHAIYKSLGINRERDELSLSIQGELNF